MLYKYLNSAVYLPCKIQELIRSSPVYLFFKYDFFFFFLVTGDQNCRQVLWKGSHCIVEHYIDVSFFLRNVCLDS